MNDLVKVDSQDTLVAAVDDAMARAAAIFGSNERTLIDSVSQSDWDVWDASGEKPNCADACWPARLSWCSTGISSSARRGRE